MSVILTDRGLRVLPSPASGYKIYYDAEVKGFGVRVTAAGAKSFVLTYRVSGRQRRYTIGSFPDWSVSDARREAKALKQRIDRGEDPMEARDAERNGLTIADLCARYLDHATRKNRPRSVAEARSLIRQYIEPELGRGRIAELRRDDVEKLHREVSRTTPVRANRLVSLLRRILNLAILWELREPNSNPATRIERNAENRSERFLRNDELARLIDAIAQHGNKQTANIIKLAMLTGARRSELLGATWQQIDLVAGTWTKPASTTKQARSHTIPLSAGAICLLAEMRTAADRENERRCRDSLPEIAHLFPSKGASGRQTDLKQSWKSICRAAGIDDLRFHDLRHSFASFLVSGGASLPLIGALLGHSQPGTTSRYAHLALDPLRVATERVGAIIDAAGKPGADILQIRGGRRT